MAWWKKALLLRAGLPAVWVCGLNFAGSYGYPSQYFWLSASIAAIGFAVAPFWRFRSSNWYWPTIAAVGLIHLTALYFERQFIGRRELPPKGLFLGMLVIDCMAIWGIMVGVCWVTTRRFPWQLPDP